MKRTLILLTLSTLLSLYNSYHGQGGQAFSAVASFDTPNTQDRYLDIDVSNNLALSDAYTIEAWIKVPASSDGYVSIIESYSSTPGFGGYELSISNGKIAASVYGFSVQTGFSTTSISYNTWQHIAATYDGADELKIYLNGTLDKTFNFGIDNFNFATELFIGANGAGAPNDESILIDEVRIWEDVRTNQEINDNLNSCLTGQETGLVLYYDFEQTSGLGFVTDQGPLGYHATIIHEQNNSFVTGVFSCCNIDVSTSVSSATISASSNGLSYQWIDCDNGNANILGATSQSYTPIVNGNYAVIITDGNCSDTSDCVAITSTNIETLSPVAIKLFPNPVSDHLIIQSNKPVESVTIYDLIGTIAQKEHTSSFFVDKLIPGIYLIEITSNNQIMSKRFIKK